MNVLAGRLFGTNGPYRVDFVHVTLQFKLEDMWVGVFWKNESTMMIREYTIWICILPTLPICIRRVKYL